MTARSPDSERSSEPARGFAALGARLAPDHLFTRSKDELRRARLVMYFALLVAALAPPLGLVQYFFGTKKILYVIIPVGLMGPAAIILTRRFRSVAVGANMLIALVALGITVVGIQRGGFGQPIMMTYLVVPILGMVLGGHNSGLWWLIISILLQCGVGLAQLFFGLPAYPLANVLATNWPSHIAFIFAVYLLMNVHNRLRRQAMEDQRATEDRLLESERRREASETEAHLLRTSRLAELGTLAAGVAHEINNPLTYVQGNIDYLIEERSTLPEEEIKEVLDDALSGTERIQRIVQDIRMFSHADSDDDLQPIDLREVLDSSINLLQNSIRQVARLERDYHPIPLVAASAPRLGQVFVNLLHNAVQALEESEGLKEGVKGEQDEGEILLRTFVADDGSVVAEVKDTGAGMPPEVKSRVFEPFFTTKSVGVGTGLGLSICYGIVTKLGGSIALDSAEGKGTTVSVSFPASAVALREESTPAVELKLPEQTRILIIDDDPDVRAVFTRLLSAHQREQASSSKEALQLLAAGETFDAILCDVMMPNQSGVDFYRAVERDHPDHLGRIIFITGGTFAAREREFVEKIQNPCLDKPVDTAKLKRVIHKTIKRNASRG